MLGQPSSMLIPPVVGFRLTGRLPEGTTATDLVLTVTEALRKTGRGRQVRRVLRPGPRAPDASPTARRSATCAPSTARRSRSSRSTTMTLDYLRLTGRDAAQVALVEAYAKAQGLFRTDATPDAAYSRHARARPRAPSSRAWPVRGVRRTACRSRNAKPSFASALRRAAEGRQGRGVAAAAAAGRVAASATQLDHGSVVIAAITSCTNTSNPSVMIGAGLLAKKAVEHGPHAQAVGEDAASRPARRWSPSTCEAPGLHAVPRRSSASTSSATAARPASATAARCPTRSAAAIARARPGRRVGAVRQPQLRGPHPAGRARQLPGVAAAGRRLRARRLDEHRPHDRAARHTARDGTAGLPEGHLADRAGDPGGDARRVTARDVPRAVRQRVRGRRALAGAAGADRRPLRVGRRLDLHPPAAVLRGPVAGAGAARPTSAARACWRCSATASPPTTSRRPASIKADSPAGKYLIAHGVAPADFNSYGARRGNHEVMMRGTFANIRLQEPAGARRRGRRDRAPARRRA